MIAGADSVRKRHGFYAGVGSISAAVLMLQIVQTRILSVVAWYHLAFLVISVAMLGLTVGAVWVYLRPERFESRGLDSDLVSYSLRFAAATVVSLVLELTIPLLIQRSASALVAWIELVIVLAVPFAFAGVVVTLALTRSPRPVPLTYAADLIGAALGCLGVLLLLRILDGPSAVIAIAALAAIGALLFALASSHSSHRWRSRRLAILPLALLALAAVNAASPARLRPLFVKQRVEYSAPEYARWNAISMVELGELAETSPAMWGPSPVFDAAAWSIQQKLLRIDGDAGTVMYHLAAGPASAGFLRWDVTSFAYYVRSFESAAIIGVGGGRDLLAARVFGVPEITGIDINPIFIDLLTRHPTYRRYAGLDTLGVRFVADEARSWLARSDDRFDLIQMSLIDTWAATGAGAFTLSENGLYTVEAWRMLLDRLRPGGIVAVSRWYWPERPWETGRLLSLALDAGRRSGFEDPRAHVLVATSGQIATLLLSRSPFTAADLVRVRAASGRLRFSVLVQPGASIGDPTLAAIASATSPAEVARRFADSPFDFRPPTDDRPFFFNQLRVDRPIAAMSAVRRMGGLGIVGGNLAATETLGALFLIAALAVALTILLPLRSALRHVGAGVATAGSLYFTLIGIGFMAVEIGLLQRMSAFLGHPIYSLAIVLFAIILSTGAGSLLSARLGLRARRHFVLWWALLSLYLSVLPGVLAPLLLHYDGATLPVRAAVAIAALAPAGLLMGWAFPTGLRLVTAGNPMAAPWFWGINGAAGVLASIGAVGSSLTLGIHGTLLIGAACYALLLPCALFLEAEARRAGDAPPGNLPTTRDVLAAAG